MVGQHMKNIALAAILASSILFAGCATIKPAGSTAPAVNTCDLNRPTAVIRITPAKSTSKMNFCLGAKRKRHPSAVETIFGGSR